MKNPIQYSDEYPVARFLISKPIVKGHSLDTESAATDGEYGIESRKSIDSKRVSS